jgi:hypothetical protein
MKSSQRSRESAEDLELKFRILSTEYSALVQRLGSISAVSAARTNLYFVFLSATGVSLALISNASHFTREFEVFALGVLLLNLLGGLMAMARMLHAHGQTVLYIQSLNRIRHFFTEFNADVQPYFTLPVHDDEAGIVESTSRHPSLWAMTVLPAASMATLVALVNTFLVGAIAATVYLVLGGSATMALVYAGVAFVIASIVIWGWLFLELHRIRRRLVIRFSADH